MQTAQSSDSDSPRHVLVIGDSMSLAHVARAMVLTRRLLEEGHRVTFATGAPHQNLAKQEGFDPLLVHCVPPEQALAAIRRGSHIFDLKTVGEYVESDLSLISKVQPDLIIGDMRMSLNVSAELAGVPYWSIVSGYMTPWYSVEEHPPETFPIVRLLGQRISRAIFPTLKRMTLKQFAKHFNRYRRHQGLRPVRNVLDVICSPHGNLIADMPEYAPCTNLPGHFRYVGPLLWEPQLPEPDWLANVKPDQPTVYVTLGSTGDERSATRVLTVLRDQGYQVLTTTGGRFTDVPAGVLAAEYAPGSCLLAKSQAVVCHGGSLTVYQAVSQGVPIVGIPTFHDQETNMDRVTSLGWGAEIPPGRWRSQDLLRAVERVMDDEVAATMQAAKARLAACIAESAANRLLPGRQSDNTTSD